VSYTGVTPCNFGENGNISEADIFIFFRSMSNLEEMGIRNKENK
jgi:hypothetical protein